MKQFLVYITLLSVCVLCTVLVYNEYNKEKCGVEASTNLIHHNPWLVYLEYHRRYRVMETRCAATLLDSRHLLTAAHCVKIRFTKLVARLGEYDTTSKRDCMNGICADPILRVAVAAVHVHPDYDGSHHHDIAVLELAEEVPYTDFIRPVCLPTGNLASDTAFIAAGWGENPANGEYSKIKKIIPLPNWPVTKCQNVYRITLPDNIICAGGVENQDTCRGDSGGPLMWVRDRVELWGVTSAGNPYCGMAGTPGIYTSVTAHLQWINSHIMR